MTLDSNFQLGLLKRAAVTIWTKWNKQHKKLLSIYIVASIVPYWSTQPINHVFLPFIKDSRFLWTTMCKVYPAYLACFVINCCCCNCSSVAGAHNRSEPERCLCPIGKLRIVFNSQIFHVLMQADCIEWQAGCTDSQLGLIRYLMILIPDRDLANVQVSAGITSIGLCVLQWSLFPKNSGTSQFVKMRTC